MNQNPTILVIEDEDLLLDAIKRKLEVSNINAVSFKTGNEALAFLKGQNHIPDAIWLDFYLQDMNGEEFMEEVKKNPVLQTIPVIVVSNSANPEKVQNLLALGARKYFLKAEHRLDDIINFILQLVDENKTNKSHVPADSI